MNLMRQQCRGNLAALMAMWTIIIYQLILVMLIFLRPDLDPAWQTISEWALGQYGWIMTGAFELSAFSYAALFVLLKSQMRGGIGKAGLAVLLICVCGTIGVGVFTMDPPDWYESHGEPTTTGLLHIIFGSSALMLFSFAALMMSIGLLQNQDWSPAHSQIKIAVLVPLAGFLAFALHTYFVVVPLGNDWHMPGVNAGWVSRFTFLCYAIWIVLIARLSIAVRHQEKPQ